MAPSRRPMPSSSIRALDPPGPVGLVVAIAAVALVLRFVFLGQRVAHWDEARVAYWTLHYLQTGDFHYRYIIHGPFVQIVGRPVFAVFGATDVAARAIVALVGGLLPMAALLFREHLRPDEVVVAALLLAVNPLLLYYSRFYRSSVLVAAFMLTAFGLFVRAYDTHRVRYVHAGVVLVALGFAAKENAVVYLLVWLGAGVLVVDHALFRPHDASTGLDRLAAGWERVRPARGAWRGSGLRVSGHALVAAGLFALVIVFFYAPRSGSPAGLGLWQAVTQPSRMPALLDHMAADISSGYDYWFGGAAEPGCFQSNLIDSYACFLRRSLRVLAGYGVVAVLFGVGGFLYERYAAGRPRTLVLFAAYWGFASLLGYPLGMDIFGPWVLVNVVVPLAIPAAVGIVAVYRSGRQALASDDRVDTVLVAVVLLLAVGQVATAGLTGVYLNPQGPDNDLVQYAQPAGDFREELRQLEVQGEDGSGPRVLVYGAWLVDGQTEAVRQPPCVDWFNALPLPWYFAANDVRVVCAANQTQLERRLDPEPAVVIARANETATLSPYLEEYTATTYDFRASVDPRPPRITFFVRTDPEGPTG